MNFIWNNDNFKARSFSLERIDMIQRVSSFGRARLFRVTRLIDDVKLNQCLTRAYHREFLITDYPFGIRRFPRRFYSSLPSAGFPLAGTKPANLRDLWKIRAKRDSLGTERFLTLCQEQSWSFWKIAVAFTLASRSTSSFCNFLFYAYLH